MQKRAKYGGRKIGTPNRTTIELKQFIVNLIGDNLELMHEDLMKVSPGTRLRILIEFAKIVIPQTKAIDESNNTNFQPFTIVLSNPNNNDK